MTRKETNFYAIEAEIGNSGIWNVGYYADTKEEAAKLLKQNFPNDKVTIKNIEGL